MILFKIFASTKQPQDLRSWDEKFLDVKKFKEKFKRLPGTKSKVREERKMACWLLYQRAC